MTVFGVRVHRNGLFCSEQCFKETILQRRYKKMTIKWSFSYNSLYNFRVKRNRSHNMTVFGVRVHRNGLCCSEQCNEGTILQRNY